MSKTVVLLVALAVLSVGAQAGYYRDRSERAAFVREQPCPATGRSRGPCAGWQVDHITPLKCGGADSPYNMQWLTIEAHKAKTRREAWMCRR